MLMLCPQNIKYFVKIRNWTFDKVYVFGHCWKNKWNFPFDGLYIWWSMTVPPNNEIGWIQLRKFPKFKLNLFISLAKFKSRNYFQFFFFDGLYIWQRVFWSISYDRFSLDRSYFGRTTLCLYNYENKQRTKNWPILNWLYSTPSLCQKQRPLALIKISTG